MRLSKNFLYWVIDFPFKELYNSRPIDVIIVFQLFYIIIFIFLPLSKFVKEYVFFSISTFPFGIKLYPCTKNLMFKRILFYPLPIFFSQAIVVFLIVFIIIFLIVIVFFLI